MINPARNVKAMGIGCKIHDESTRGARDLLRIAYAKEICIDAIDIARLLELGTSAEEE